MKRPILICVSIVFLTICVKANNFGGVKTNEHNIIAPSQSSTQSHFPGGEKAFSKFLDKNLKWPDQIDGQGRVIVSFVVEKDGHLTNIKIAKKSLPEFDNEALRVIKKSPRWIPATRNGIPIKSVKSVPINFTISE